MPRLLAALLILWSAPALAGGASPWSRDGAAALRLIDGGPAEGEPGARLAAISIALDPGWKTYWRQPGASGVPPRFDFSRSKNLAEAKIAYPAPERVDDPEGVTNVYHGLVTLAVTVRPVNPAQPVELRLTADYGVCEAVCVPVRAEAGLDLATGAQSGGPEALEAREAAAAAPRPAPLGAAGPLAVSSVRRVATQGSAAVEIDVAAPAGAEPPVLFAETGEGDFAPAPEPIGRPAEGKARFRISFDEPDLPKSGLKLTLAAGGRAIETAVALDAVAPAP